MLPLLLANKSEICHDKVDMSKQSFIFVSFEMEALDALESRLVVSKIGSLNVVAVISVRR